MGSRIENFAGVVIENNRGEVLVVRKLDDYAYAIPWCRVLPGQSLQDCLKERVRDLTGLAVQPVFLGPNEHIEKNSHFISFDHIARIDGDSHHYQRDDLEYLWVAPAELDNVPLVPLTRKLLAQYRQKDT